MDELIKIIALVSEYTDVPKWNIVLGTSRGDTKARHMVCHILWNGFPHLVDAFAEASENGRPAIIKASHVMDDRLANDLDLLDMMNDIRKELDMPLIKTTERNPNVPKTPSNTMRLFGFDYTEEERRRYKNVVLSSKIFMRKMCSFGRKPLADGLVFTASQKRIFSSWYKD